MRYLNKIVFLNSAHVPYAEIRVDGNVHFVGTQGVGKSTLLRAILFFYNADKLRLGIPKEKRSFDAFYLPFANSYIVYEVMREHGAYSIVVLKSMGRAAFRFVDAPYAKEWFVNSRNEVASDWTEIRTRIVSTTGASISPLVIRYEMFRDIVFGNNRSPEMIAFRKFAIVESARYQNIPRTIQNVFLNSKLDADFIKDTIIQSMTDEALSIDLAYYRSQVEAFGREYEDVMLWLKPNKNGEIVVRKQADQVIRRYRELLYARRQVAEGRAELNHAEQTAQRRLPQLDAQIRTDMERVEAARRRIREADEKNKEERDNLVRRDGSISDDLQRIAAKREFYDREKIGEVMSRVAREEALMHEYKSLQNTYTELTATYRDVIQKYGAMIDRLDTDLAAAENAGESRILELKEANRLQEEKLLENLREQESQIRTDCEVKLRACNDRRVELTRELTELRFRKKQLRGIRHFDEELARGEAALAALAEEERMIDLEITRKRMEGERLREQCDKEIRESEMRFDADLERLTRQQQSFEPRIEQLNRLLDRRKGSFCEWLEANRPGWQETIGKVANEERILYSHGLNPQLDATTSVTFFGVRVDLSGVECDLRTPEQLRSELSEATHRHEALGAELLRLGQEKAAASEEIRKRYRGQIREIVEAQHLQEARLQQCPVRHKVLQAELSDWQRKENEWQQNQQELLEAQLTAKSLESGATDEALERLENECKKSLQQLGEAFQKDRKIRLEQLNESIRTIESARSEQRERSAEKRAELLRSQRRELEGKGADTTVIEHCKEQLEALDRELAYIREKRSLVSDYEKDKREYFDREELLRRDKLAVESRIEALARSVAEQMERLLALRKEVEQALSDDRKELAELQSDLEKLRLFRADDYLSPPESSTADLRSTERSCGEIVEDLKRQIFAIQRDTDDFKRAVNLFKGNFTVQNTFSFPLNLTDETDYYDFAANLSEFVEDNKIQEYQNRISERYANIIHRISKEVGRLTEHESEILRTIRAINDDFVKRNFAGVIRGIELRSQPGNDLLMQLLVEIKRFHEENQFNLGSLDLFSQQSRGDVNEQAVRYLYAFSRRLNDEPSRKNLVLADTFNLQFRIQENDNDTGWVEKIANVGSDGTDILVKAMVNIMLINVFKEKASRRFGDFKLHCMMDEIGKLHPTNVKGILAFANCRNILLINSSPTTYNVEDYRYTYLLRKDAQSRTQVIPLLTRREP